MSRWRTTLAIGGAAFLLGMFWFKGCSSFSGNIRDVSPIGKYEGLTISQVNKRLAKDAYLIQSPYDPNRNLSVDAYIKNKFGNKFDRKMEKLKLEKVIDQFSH